MTFDPFAQQSSGNGNGGVPGKEANDFLMGSTVKAAAFKKIGTVVQGKLTRPPELRQQTDMKDGSLKFWDDGRPMQQLYVLIQTEERDPAIEGDDGVRALFIKANMQKAVADAVKKSGASGLDTGGTLAIKYVSDGEETRKGWQPPKNYQAAYKPPETKANSFLNDTPKEPEPVAANNDLPDF